MKLSVVIPMFNEAENAENLVSEVNSALENIDHEIVIVDDKSTDNTAEILKKLQSKFSQLKVVCHKINSGQSTAIATGVINASNDTIATLDGDGQNPPDQIINLLMTAEKTSGSVEKAVENYLFAGHRQKRKDNLLKLISSKLGNGIRRSLLKDDCPDTGCGLKLFSKKVFSSIPHFNHMHRYLPALFKRQGLGVVNVPISHRSREFGKSKYGFWGRLKVGIFDLFGVAWLIRRPCNEHRIKENAQ